MTCALCEADGVPRHVRAAGKMVPLCSNCWQEARQGKLTEADIKRLRGWEEPDGDTGQAASPTVPDVQEADDRTKVSPGQSVEVPAEDG